MGKSEHYSVGLDIGTTHISCVVGEVNELGEVQIVGLGEAPSRGLRKGLVVNLDATVDSIKEAVAEAELMAGHRIESATIGIEGGHIRSFNSRGVIAIGGKERIVSRDDLKRVMEAAKAVSIPQDREILHVLSQEYVLDEQRGINAPLGLIGAKLEANVHIITAASTSVQNLVTCVNRAGIEVLDTVLEQLAVSESVLSADEKELGVLLIDIGGGTTDLAIFEKGSIWHTAVLPVGGDHFTNDLAVGLRSPIPDAEKLKKKYGCALASMVQENEAVEVPSVGGRKPRLLSLQVMSEILQPRAEEIFTLINEDVTRAGFDKSLNAGVVLTGGGSMLPGMIEVSEQIFDMPVRRGQPGGAEGLVESSAGPSISAAVGLAIYGVRKRQYTSGKHAISFGIPAGAMNNFGSWFRSWFSNLF